MRVVGVDARYFKLMETAPHVTASPLLLIRLLQQTPSDRHILRSPTKTGTTTPGLLKQADKQKLSCLIDNRVRSKLDTLRIVPFKANTPQRFWPVERSGRASGCGISRRRTESRGSFAAGGRSEDRPWELRCQRRVVSANEGTAAVGFDWIKRF